MASSRRLATVHERLCQACEARWFSTAVCTKRTARNRRAGLYRTRRCRHRRPNSRAMRSTFTTRCGDQTGSGRRVRLAWQTPAAAFSSAQTVGPNDRSGDRWPSPVWQASSARSIAIRLHFRSDTLSNDGHHSTATLTDAPKLSGRPTRSWHGSPGRRGRAGSRREAA